jgi:hypothetical protein
MLLLPRRDRSAPGGASPARTCEVARAIARTRLAALEGHALGEIQDWTNRDEAVVSALRRELANGARVPASYAEGAYAAHAVAAAVYEAVAGGAPPARAMDGMVGVLAEMHARNRAWTSPPAAPGTKRPPPPWLAAELVPLAPRVSADGGANAGSRPVV